MVTHTHIACRIGVYRVRNGRDLIPLTDHNAVFIKAIGSTINISLEWCLSPTAPVLLRVRSEVEPHLLVVFVAPAVHSIREIRPPVMVELAACVERVVRVRIVACVHRWISVLEHHALVADPVGQHSAALVKGVSPPVDFPPKVFTFCAEPLVVYVEVVSGAAPVIVVWILFTVNEDLGVSYHAAVLIHIEVIAAERKGAVL